MPRRILTALIVLSLVSCARLTMTIPPPPGVESDPIELTTTLVSDSDMTMTYERDCPEGTPLEQRHLCPMGVAVTLTSMGLEGGVVKGTLGLAAGAVKVFGGGGGATVNVNDGGTVNLPDQ